MAERNAEIGGCLLSFPRDSVVPSPTPTLTKLLVAEELITKWLDVGSAVQLIYLDFSSAFYSVNHRLLLDQSFPRLGSLRGCECAHVLIVRTCKHLASVHPRVEKVRPHESR